MSSSSRTFIVKDGTGAGIPFEQCEVEIQCPVEYIDDYGPVDGKLIFPVRDFAKDTAKVGRMQLDDFDFDGWLVRFKPPTNHDLEHYDQNGLDRWNEPWSWAGSNYKTDATDVRNAFADMSSFQVPGHCFIFRYNKTAGTFDR
jgi:hypothetical protein